MVTNFSLWHSVSLICYYFITSRTSHIKQLSITYQRMPGKIKCFSIMVSTRYTRFNKPKFITDIYQCSLFLFYKIHLCTCSYRIPWYCYKQHYHYSCVLCWHTRLYLKQQKESNWKTFNWNDVDTNLFALTWCVSQICYYFIALRTSQIK